MQTSDKQNGAFLNLVCMATFLMKLDTSKLTASLNNLFRKGYNVTVLVCSLRQVSFDLKYR